MLTISIAILPFIVIALVNFFLSWLWYSPVLFLKPWQKGLGIPPDHKMTDSERKAMPFLFIGGLFASFALSFVLQVLVVSLQATTFVQGLLIGILCWFGFALTHSLNTLWEGRKVVVITINNGLFLFSYALFGAIAAVWR